MSILVIVAGVALALVMLCVVIAAMCPPKEYKGDLGSAGGAESSGKTSVLFVGRKEA